MLQFLKRLFGRDSPAQTAQDVARARAARRKPSSASFRSTGPAPLGNIVEGDSEQDWSEWESSMMTLDSQLQDLPESARVYEKEGSGRYTKPAPLAPDDDTFGKVGKNRDI